MGVAGSGKSTVGAELAREIGIPYRDGELLLGTWQGIYLWEHRHHAGQRQVLVHL